MDSGGVRAEHGTMATQPGPPLERSLRTGSGRLKQSQCGRTARRPADPPSESPVSRLTTALPGSPNVGEISGLAGSLGRPAAVLDVGTVGGRAG